ncbi:HTH domain-containing protein [Neobacillus drentensis]|uniref:HTH domain-containing protein n=1 Tax=Neobacillus drentensis TaxID=220684 RepID=UPI001F43C2D2|nr:helix-turn-helix domain-containing protein [Neobacillus drentensis]
MSKRQKDIVLSLMKEKEPVTAEWMAKELGVSDRTIRTEIKELQSQSSSLGIIIESVRGKGYLLDIKDYELFDREINPNANDAIDNNQSDFSEQANRVLYILKRFLIEKEPLHLRKGRSFIWLLTGGRPFLRLICSCFCSYRWAI